MRRSLALLACAFVLSAAWARAEEPVPPASVEAPELSDADDQFWRGFNLLHGRGVPVDLAESTLWFRRAAEQGHLRAQVHLGFAYLKGRGVKVDVQEAHKWLSRAAEQGHPKAQMETGLDYWHGRGVNRDRVEGLKWMLLSLGAGSPVGRALVPQYLRLATLEERRAARERANEWRIAHGLPVPKSRTPADEAPAEPAPDAPR